MAASSRKPCLCCSELKSKCFGLCSKKCDVLNVTSNLQLLFKEKIDFLYIIDSVVCEHCVHLIGKFTTIRDNIRKATENHANYVTTPKQNKKRIAQTPPSRLRRQTVIESLVQSVEKMKTTNATSEKVSRRRIHFDHVYTKPDQTETGDSKRIDDDVIKSVMNEILDRFVHEHSHCLTQTILLLQMYVYSHLLLGSVYSYNFFFGQKL